ncbi:C4-dicarboxylate ABC transporter substrate-binding protein [Planococcus glaciei]|uniref:TRAP transporter substrate-binding protein n=1 Tax=Planococcus glaciei TaxID=459472 RepID=UPI00069E849B|nr:TRAP transporter substrate-binding protein [Planococcus glaciei]KOF10284.1 C4-dicarboxylate ABC transporter substrate-binding protein [Planococcus glaciei]
MKKQFKSLALVTALASMTLLAACGDSSSDAAGSAGETKVLKVAFNQPENHPQYKAMEEFGEQIKEKTEGAYEIELYPNELLGAQRETVELVQSGTIGMSIVAGSLLESFNEEFSVFNLPYVFDSREHQMSVLNDPEIVGDLYKSVEGQGLTVLGAFHGGVRNVYNKTEPIETPEDLKGQKIRIIESDTNLQMMSAMGGVGTPLGQGEVYTAIQSGVLDGGENNELIYANLKHVEIAPYYSYTKHLMLPDYLVIGSEILKGMSDEHKVVFEEELAEAIDLEVELWEEDTKTAIKTAEDAGAKFNEVDIKPFQEAVQPLIEEKLTTDSAKELYQKVRDAVQ